MAQDLRVLRPDEVRRLALSAAPAAVAGLLLQDAVERRLGRPSLTALLMALSAGALWVVDRQAEGGGPPGRQRPLSSRDVRAASLAQVAALAPGVSRTGVTLTALRARGVDRDLALRTSYVMSLPITLGAAGLTVRRGRQAPPLVPSVLAGVTSYAAARRAVPPQRLITASVIYRLAVALVVPAVARRRKEPR